MSRDYTALGRFIRERRQKPGWSMSQLQLAQAIGRSTSAVSRWERGHRCPKQSSLLELAKVLGVPVQVLQQKAGHTPEFDWYSSFAQANPTGQDILLTATNEEKDELRAHLKYLRFRATVLEIGKPRSQH